MCVLKKKNQIRIYGARTKFKKQVQKLSVQRSFHVLLLVCLPICSTLLPVYLILNPRVIVFDNKNYFSVREVCKKKKKRRKKRRELENYTLVLCKGINRGFVLT